MPLAYYNSITISPSYYAVDSVPHISQSSQNLSSLPKKMPGHPEGSRLQGAELRLPKLPRIKEVYLARQLLVTRV